MSSRSKTSRGMAKVLGTAAVSLLLIFSTVTLAFGDFVSVSSNKVLGVGRIQSVPSATPIAVEKKFAIASSEVATEETPVLVEPIAREVAVVETTPEPTPETYADQPSLGYETTPPVTTDGWIVTVGTNYGTPGDDFLNKITASGEYTTTTSMGVAHKHLPLGTVIELYCPQSGLSCIATVNDRGPYGGANGAKPDTFDFQMGVTAALGNNYGWYEVHYRIIG